jgi:hypothetical protein
LVVSSFNVRRIRSWRRFCRHRAVGLSKLSLGWIKLGIVHERILIRAGIPYSRIAASQIARTWLRSMRDDLAANQIAAVRVGDGERITALAVAGAEVSFGIHAPLLIRTRNQGKRL